MPPRKGNKTAAGAKAEVQLISTARALLESSGVGGVTFRAIARELHITPMAPYRHFPDGPRELLAVIATRGFDEMIQFLSVGSDKDGHRRIVELGLRYVQFGVEHPNLYRALFHPDLAEPLARKVWEGPETHVTTARHYRELFEVKDRAFNFIVNALTEAKSAGALGKGDPVDFALALAALCHGLVGEFIDEGLYLEPASDGSPWSDDRRRMSRRVIKLLVAGFRA